MQQCKKRTRCISLCNTSDTPIQISCHLTARQPARSLLRSAAVRRVPLVVAMAGSDKNTPATDFGQVGSSHDTGMHAQLVFMSTAQHLG